MTKTVLAMTSVKHDGDEALEKYLAVVEPLMEAAGAKLISRYEVSKILFGIEIAQFVSLIEYPDDKSIQMVFSSPDYVSLKHVKEMAFSRYEICVLA